MASLIGILVALLLVMVAALLWQEATSRRRPAEMMYIIGDAVDHVCERLHPEVGLKRADVLRIIEWEVHQLQGLASQRRRSAVDVVAGGTPQSVEYIADQIAHRHGVIYAHREIEAVLALEADYLHSIGAVGSPVEGAGETAPETPSEISAEGEGP